MNKQVVFPVLLFLVLQVSASTAEHLALIGDRTTALNFCQALFVAVVGEKAASAELPYNVSYKDGRWEVNGVLSGAKESADGSGVPALGGGLHIVIRALDGGVVEFSSRWTQPAQVVFRSLYDRPKINIDMRSLDDTPVVLGGREGIVPDRMTATRVATAIFKGRWPDAQEIIARQSKLVGGVWIVTLEGFVSARSIGRLFIEINQKDAKILKAETE